MNVTMVGIDIAKSIFHVHAVDRAGHFVERRRLRRSEVLKYFARFSRIIVALEACGTAHHWARAFEAQGHEVRLIPPSYVKAYVKRGKNDAIDAAAICEAASRPSMRFVPVKSHASQARLCRHRSRELLVRQRTMLINSLRSQMAEFGLISGRGGAGLKRLLEMIAAPSQPLPDIAREVFEELADTLLGLQVRIDRLEKAIRKEAQQDPVARGLMSIPGIGPISASAFAASIGDPKVFRNGRHFAAWLGLTAREHSTGGKVRLGRISKMGDRYLRKLLVLGATSRLRRAQQGKTPLDRWTSNLLARKSDRQKRLVAIALANKTARILWAVMTQGGDYQPDCAAA